MNDAGITYKVFIVPSLLYRLLNIVTIENEEVLNVVADAATEVFNTLRLLDPGCSRLNGK
jgi:hypothetical protein